MNTNKHSLLESVALGFVLGFLPAFISAISLLGGAMDSPDPSVITKILLWNIVMAVELISSGLLPACVNCEMAILLYVVFYGFVIGLIGYSLAFFCGILLIRRSRNY